jgi:hypothetical protein
MKIKTMTRCALALAAALMAPAAMANFTTSVAGVTGAAGGNTGAVVIRFAGNGVTQDAQIDYVYADNATAPVPTPTGQNGWTCTTAVAPAGQRLIRAQSPSGAVLPAGPTDACSVVFALPAGAASPQYPVTVRPATAADPSPAQPIQCGPAGPQPCTGTNFTVGIAAGVYQSVPAPGAAVVINDVVGGGATTATLTVTNGAAAAGPGLTLSSITGLSGVLSIAPGSPQTIAAGANQAFTISCAATTAGPGTAQTLTIVHNGGAPGAASPVTHSVTCNGVTGPSAPTAALGAVTNPAAGPINTSGSGSVVVNVTGAGNSVSAGDASLALACTVPAGTASFAITGGANRTINAPATLGANAPPIAFSCTRQAAVVAATITCTQTATPGPNPANLTAAIECPAGTTAPNPGVNPASGTAFNFVGGPSTALSSAISFTNTGGTAPYNITGCTFSPVVAGYTVTGAFPLAVAAGGSANINVGCTTPATPGTALAATTLTCASSITAPPAFAPSFPVTCRAEQVVPVPAMSAGGKAMMALLVLLVGLVGFQLYRRNA